MIKLHVTRFQPCGFECYFQRRATECLFSTCHHIEHHDQLGAGVRLITRRRTVVSALCVFVAACADAGSAPRCARDACAGRVLERWFTALFDDFNPIERADARRHTSRACTTERAGDGLLIVEDLGLVTHDRRIRRCLRTLAVIIQGEMTLRGCRTRSSAHRLILCLPMVTICNFSILAQGVLNCRGT